MKFIERLAYLRTNRCLHPFVNFILLLFQVEIPKSVIIGKDLRLQHRGMGTVIHPLTRIGNNVEIYNGVTIGLATPWDDSFIRNLKINLSNSNQGMKSAFCIDIQDDVILCTGCKVLCKEGTLVIGKGTIVGANAVLNCSTGDNEIWAGVPAKCIGKRGVK